jgi:hypothetical protein
MSHQTQGLALEYLHSCLNTLGDSTGHLPGMHLKDPKHRNTNPVGRQNTHSQRSQHRTNQHNRRHTQLLKFTRRQDQFVRDKTFTPWLLLQTFV